MQKLPLQLLSTVLLATCAMKAQDIKIGDVIHLKSKFSSGGVEQFLDTQGRVMDYNKEQAKSHNLLVVTNKTSNRDNGSGSWKIISHSKKDGESLLLGDRISLQNMFPYGGYLDEADVMWKEEYTALFPNSTQNDYPVFTANRATGNSETWVVVGANDNVKNGTPVAATKSALRLESAAHPKYYLRFGHGINELAKFKNFPGRSVFTSSGNFNANGDYIWFMIPKQQ
jgi:hypothetical protein